MIIKKEESLLVDLTQYVSAPCIGADPVEINLGVKISWADPVQINLGVKISWAEPIEMKHGVKISRTEPIEMKLSVKISWAELLRWNLVWRSLGLKYWEETWCEDLIGWTCWDET